MLKILPSTLRFLKEADKIPGYPLLERLHGYVYSRWPYFYIGVGIGEHKWAKFMEPLADMFVKLYPPRPDDEEVVSWADSYHGKAVPLDAAKQLVSIKRDIEIRNLEKVIPYKCARDIILKNPDHIAVLDCPCRVARDNPCMPLDVCLIIGEPFASFIVEHNPDKARFISQDEAMKVLEETDARGNVHHAFFKEAMLDRFYAICNCCSCCCGAMQAQRNGVPMLCSSGYLARPDNNLCQQCGKCINKCQFNALSLGGGAIQVDPEACMGCGVCVNNCPSEAMSLVRCAEKGEPLEIVRLMAETN